MKFDLKCSIEDCRTRYTFSSHLANCLSGLLRQQCQQIVPVNVAAWFTMGANCFIGLEFNEIFANHLIEIIPGILR